MSNSAPFQKADPNTQSERYLARMGERLFLSLWSYPCVFRNQGNLNGREGKEVCDLLVVFGNHVLIFSDKDCLYPNTGSENRDWCRWFRSSIVASAKQVWGAERWLRTHPTRLFLDRSCKQVLPVRLPEMSSMIVHRIVIARTAAKRCRKYFKGGSGSLFIDPEITESNHYANEALVKPFRIGDIDPAKGFMHIFDGIGLSVLMSELDTTADFVDYLSKRERFLRSGKCGSACGEEELLAYFLHKLDASNEHDFVIPKHINHASFLEGLWDDYVKSDHRMRRIDADEISYTWDRLIEKLNFHILNGTSYNISEAPERRGEAVRMLASERRTSRRLLAKSLLEHMSKSKIGDRSARVHMPLRLGGPHYVFLALSDIHSKSEIEYRTIRTRLLEAYCMVAKLQFPDAADIVGIATEPGIRRDGSEDVIWLDTRNWNAEYQAEAESIQRDFGLLTKCGPVFRGKEHEFPAPALQRTARPGNVGDAKVGRNSTCTCGSGRKWKKCCMNIRW